MSASPFDLSGRLALITGSSRGIGYALAGGLARAGARVVLNGRRDPELQAAVAQLRGEGHDVTGRAFDVSDEAAVADGIGRVEAEAGPLDILVNNAGVQHRQPLGELGLGDWRRLIDTNVTSAFLVSRSVAPAMMQRGRGKIINVCSLQSEVVRPGIGAYAATKGALKMLTKGMCADWAPHGIQVNAIGPGYFATELTAPLRADPEFDAWLRRRTPAGRWGDPDELAGTAVFLASHASDFVNGQVIYVDGGMLSVL